MWSLRIDAIVTAMALVTACGPLPTEGDSGAPAGAVPTRSAGPCYADSRERPEGPSLCHGPGGSYIVGLPAQHDWKPGARVYLGDADELPGSRELGAAWVVRVHEEAVEVRTLVQAPNAGLVGAAARLAAGEPNVRSGHILARATKRQDATITLDIGSAAGVKVGDIYEARDPGRRDVPTGRAVVRTVHAGQSVARIMDGTGPIGVDEWVLAGSEANRRPRPVRVMLATIEGAGPQPPLRRVREALAAARKLPGAAAIQLVEPRPITVKVADRLLATLLARAREQRAEQIVWLPTDCPGGACRSVMHAVVPAAGGLDPEPLLLPASPGADGGDDARAVLGQVAFAAGMFDDASYHLRAWAGGRTPAPPEVLTRLARAELALGQRERARRWLAGAAADRGGHAYLTLAEVACQDGDPAELAALEALLAKRSRTHAELEPAHLAALLCSVTAELQTGGDPRRIDRLIRAGLTLAGDLGDRPAQMDLKRMMGELLGTQGHFSRADQLFAAALKLAAAARDRPMQARIGLDRAIVRERSGNVMQAERHARAAFKLFTAQGDEQGIAEGITILARLERRLHGPRAARALVEAERGELRGKHLERAMFALGQASVGLALERGALGAALPELTALAAAARKHGRAAEEAGLAGLFAEYYYLSGQARAARDQLDAYARGIGGERPGPAQARVQLLYARFRLQEGDAGAARRMADMALRSYVRLHDDAGAAAAHLARADIEREFGERGAAQSHYEEARRLFTAMHDTDGVYRVALGKAALQLWRGDAAGAARLFPPLIRYFHGGGNAMLALEATLMLQWAEFQRSRDGEGTLQALRASKQIASKQRYARLEAEAQMLIACVHRLESDHVVAEQELAAGQKLYAALGRHAQPWRCEAGESEEPAADPPPVPALVRGGARAGALGSASAP